MSEAEEAKAAEEAAAEEEEEEEEESCWRRLESFRVKLTSAIDPSRITPYLRQCKVLSPDDEEQVLSDPSLVLRRRRAGLLLDLLQRTGRRGFVAFLESLELYYPQLYTKVTGKEPTRVFSMILDAAGESRLGELLMGEVCKLQACLGAERRRGQELGQRLGAAEGALRELRLREQAWRRGRGPGQRHAEEEEEEPQPQTGAEEEEGHAVQRQAERQEPPRAQEARDKLAEEKELLELRCASLRDHNRVYQDRIQTLLQQVEEVAAERDRGLATQEVLQRQHAQSLREKDAHRKQIRDLREKLDDLRLRLFQRERRLGGGGGRKREPVQTSDFEETSSRSSQEEMKKGGRNPQEAVTFSCVKLDESPGTIQQFSALENMPQENEALDGELMEKGRRRMKDTFEQYRRKRALRRAHKSRGHEVDWENSSGS